MIYLYGWFLFQEQEWISFSYLFLWNPLTRMQSLQKVHVLSVLIMSMLREENQSQSVLLRKSYTHIGNLRSVLFKVNVLIIHTFCVTYFTWKATSSSQSETLVKLVHVSENFCGHIPFHQNFSFKQNAPNNTSKAGNICCFRQHGEKSCLEVPGLEPCPSDSQPDAMTTGHCDPTFVNYEKWRM